MSVHVLLIGLHAAAGTTALLAGVVAIWKPRLLPLYLIALVACILLLAGAIADDWEGLGTTTRVLYLALLLLGGYMIWCGQQVLLLHRHAMANTGRYFDRLGFTLVALLDAFAIILVLRLGAPTWTAVTTALVVTAGGNQAIRMRNRRVARRRRTRSIKE